MLIGRDIEKPLPLITLGDPTRPLDARLLDAPGGFLWWYVDARDPEGNGLVLIWSFGLPFLPGSMAAARAGAPAPPRMRPALNVVLYRRGAPEFYLLQAHGPADASWSASEVGEVWRFGQSELTFHRLPEGRGLLEAHLDCPVPRSAARLTGVVRVEGPLARRATAGHAPQLTLQHEWTPMLGPSRLSAQLETGGAPFVLEAPAYHDRNGSPVSLEALGLQRWVWARTVGAASTSIAYAVWDRDPSVRPEGWSVRVDAAGVLHQSSELKVELEGRRRGRFGVPHWEAVTLRGPGASLRLRSQHLVEDGPFYLRGLGELEANGAPAAGIFEWVETARIDLDHHRPLVRMRVHETRGENSYWLPLFSGPRQGRLRRLLGFDPGAAGGSP